MSEYQKILEQSAKNSEAAENLNPEAIEDLVTRELMYLSFAVATRCEACIAFHAKAYIEAGGTREALGSLIKISTDMQGGPGGAYAMKVLQAFDEFSNQ